jgi:hypothetical protein
VSFSALR